MTQDSPDGSPPHPGTGAIASALFPGGAATGKSFVDRVDEYKRLIDDVLTGRHAWFDCPPRFGVTTLTDRMHRETRQQVSPRIRFAVCQLHKVHDSTSFFEVLLHGFGQLASQTIGHPNIDPVTIDRLFPDIRKSIYLDEELLCTLRFVAGSDPGAVLIRVTKSLNRLAQEQDCRGVMIIRDLQQILALRERDAVLQTLRQAVSESSNITWLFQGNNRHSMQRLFLNKDATLNGVVRRFTLRPINASLYAQHLATAAQLQWRCFIGRKATAMILALTSRHPYWCNELCRRLWCSDLPPVIEDVVREWSALVLQHRHLTSREMEHLSPNQRAVLICLSETPTDQPRAKDFVRRTRVSSASVGQAIKILSEQDLIHLDPEGAWTVTDPVLQWSMHQRTDVVDSIYDNLPK